jgi:hypothetical protein
VRDELVILSLIFGQENAGQRIEDECAARAIHSRLGDLIIQTDTLRASLGVPA